MKTSPNPLTISATIARRLAVQQQRLSGPLVENSPEGLLELWRQLRCIQLDPIRAVERTHLLVLWSRLGLFNHAYLDQLRWQDRAVFEYWAHAASMVLTEDYPIFRRQMDDCYQGTTKRQLRVREWLTANASFRQYILDKLKDEGPLPGRLFENRAVTPWGSSGWTNDRNVGQMLSFMWSQGDIMGGGAPR